MILLENLNLSRKNIVKQKEIAKVKILEIKKAQVISLIEKPNL